MTCIYCDRPAGTLHGSGHFHACPRFVACRRFKLSKFSHDERCECGGSREQHGKGRKRQTI